ncbi:DNA polymerase III subunit gamma and tau [Arthrobacter sp. JSM 101049]|uniref:DNA polymerase III subunit gamma and tau n=1 Tax=Arthrobacter sp. JSM 101049 TaxID=929097 RepID=UPI003566DEC0
MSTALYRRYRPDTFADVIGQEHVTTPLMAALSKNRVNHAYLFSGPRGCGKTTSARILARCLNCAQGPTPTPCGQCDSCRELATGGAGSLDVIEIDAASHGGVDDARDLRERATFAPVRDRYKIFIIDEAHMVTSAGFNALLKIVEEPPEHIKFIFATTEPDKVIGTIRSRTHHYPFRLVPPEPLMAYLERLCAQENVAVAPGVLSLVIRAGGGSVRDSLSVLDQLIAGAGPDGLDYELAVSLLGYTHASLLDDVVDAMAAQDAATVFSAVDRVIQTGHDPRRFVEDLLERFRDLIIVKAMPESAAQVIRGLPEDQLHRMNQQASLLGHAELSRSADVTNQALTEMTGATSPRLHLELLCARLLLPASDATERGVNARVDRIERRLSYAGDVPEVPAGSPAQDSASAASPRMPAHDGGASPAATGFDSPAGPQGGGPQGAAAVREALRAARGKDQPSAVPAAAAPAAPVEAPAPEPTPAPAPEPTHAPEPAHSPAAAETPAPEAAEAAVPQPSPSEVPAATPGDVSGQATDDLSGEPTTPGTGDERWTSDGPAATAPQAPAAASQPSPDWGGTWGPVEDEPARPASPAAPAADPVIGPAGSQTPNQPGTGDPAAASAPTDPAVLHPTGDVEPGPGDARQDAGTRDSGGAAGSVEMFRRAWPEIMDALREEKKFVWLTIQPHASLAGYDGRTLTVAFANPGPMKAFSAKQDNVELLQRSIHKVLGLTPEIVITAGGSAPAGGSGPKAERRPAPASRGPLAAPRVQDEPSRPSPASEQNQQDRQPDAPREPARPAPRTDDGPAAAVPTAALHPAPSAAPRPAPSAGPADRADETQRPGRQGAPAAAAPAPAPSRAETAAHTAAAPRPEAAAPAPAAAPRPASPAPQAAAPAPSGPAATGPAAALRQRRATTPPNRQQRPAAAPFPDEGPTDFGPEPEDDGGYDWGSDNVPVAPWDAPAVPSTPSNSQTSPEPATRGGTDPDGETWQRPAGPVPVEPVPVGRRGAPSAERPTAPALQDLTAAPAAPAPGTAAAPAPGAPVAPVPGTGPAPATGAGAPPSSSVAPPREAPRPAPGKPMSRYQQLLNQAKAREPQAGGTAAGPRPGGGAATQNVPADVESRYVEDIPSDDDISIEESGVVGRPAIERLLNGRLIEERNHDGTPVI